MGQRTRTVQSMVVVDTGAQRVLLRADMTVTPRWRTMMTINKHLSLVQRHWTMRTLEPRYRTIAHRAS